MTTETLTTTETAEFNKLRSYIHQHKDALEKIGEALTRIRDEKLYRGEYKNFDEFCTKEFGWGARHGYRHIIAAEVKASLPEDCDQLVTTESQARELARTPPASREKVVRAAVSRATAENRKPTAGDFAEARQQEEKPHIQAATPEQMSPQREEDRVSNIVLAASLAAKKLIHGYIAQHNIAVADCKHVRNGFREYLKASEQMDT